MDRPHLVRFLQITVSVVFGLLCFVFTELWMRSYRWETILQGVIGTERVQIGTALGVMEVYISLNVQSPNFPSRPFSPNLQSPNIPNTSWSRQSLSVPSFRTQRIVWKLHRLKPNGINIAVPHWFLVLISALLAVAPWARRRFSLQTLLIATTLVAVLLGAMVAGWQHGESDASRVPSDGIGNLFRFIPFLVLAVPVSALGFFVALLIYMAFEMILDRRPSRKK